MITTLSAREFNQNTGKAKKAAEKGPVFVTDRGKPSHVLLTIDAYRSLNNDKPSLLDLLSLPPEMDDIEFDPPRFNDLPRVPDLT